MAELKLKHQAWTRVDKHGRIVIPAEFREQLQLEPSTKVRVWVEGGALHIMSSAEGIRQIQEIACKYIVPGRSVVDELIADRRAEAARE